MPEQPEPQTEASSQPDQLVVDLQHLDVVKDELSVLGVNFAEPIPDDQALNLGLARLRDLRTSSNELLDLDDLMAEIRQQVGAKRDGWVPTMGTNRWVHTVIGAGHKPMDGGNPTPATVADVPEPDPALATAGTGVLIGIVDTPRLGPAAASAKSLSKHAGHATFVESLIQRQAPNATVEVEGVLDPEQGRADSWDIARAMMRLSDLGIDILNLSLGTYVAAGPPLAISRAIERITPKVLVVAAAGNHGEFGFLVRGRTRRSAIWPGAIPPVIAVGAVDDQGVRPPWSPDLTWISCTAPGVDVAGSYISGDVTLDGVVTPFSGFARWSGTSFAAAHVSGAIAAGTGGSEQRTARQAYDLLLADPQGSVKRFDATHGATRA